MPITKSNNAGNSGAEEQFVQLFCDTFGAEKGQYVYLQHPFVDIYGNHRTIDFAVMTEDGKVAFEIDGETWHNPGKVSEDKTEKLGTIRARYQRTNMLTICSNKIV